MLAKWRHAVPLAGLTIDGESAPGFSARKIRNYYLLNPEEEGEAALSSC
jgi:hypothetical protein